METERDSTMPVEGWDVPPQDPPWATGDVPDTRLYVESELFVAGAISTLPPFNHYHPAWALPIARQALYALGEWEPADANGSTGVPDGTP